MTSAALNGAGAAADPMVAICNQDVAAGRQTQRLLASEKRRSRRCGPDAPASSAGRKQYHVISQKPGARDRKSSDLRVIETGREGLAGNTTVVFCAHGNSFQVCVNRMEQEDLATGQKVTVQRSKHGHWYFKKSAEKSGGWMPYSSELSTRLEEVYTGCTEPPGEEPADAGGGGACGGEDFTKLLASCEERLGGGDMDQASASKMLQALLEHSVGQRQHIPAVARLITKLSHRWHVRLGPVEARQAGLVVGSMALLQAVLVTNPQMQLFGLEVFDQKYTGIKVNEQGRKDGIRSLLARGMCLGPCAPSSKLLKKVEVDSLPLWQARLCDAIQQAFAELPDPVLARVRLFLF